MNIKILSFFIIFLLCIEVYSAENDRNKPLAAYQREGLWYFVNYEGKELFPPIKLQNVLGYSEGMYCVSVKISNEEKWGFLDSTGKFAIEPKYDKAMPYSEGYAVVYEFSPELGTLLLISFIDKQGKRISKEDFVDALSFSEGLAFAFTPGGRSGYIDSTGEFVIDLKTLVGNRFNEGLAVVTDYDLDAGFINQKGEIVIPVKYESAKNFSEGLAPFNKNSKYSFINTKGEVIIQGDFDVVHEFKEGLAFVGDFYPKDLITLWGFIDKNGKFIKEYNYFAVWDFNEGLAAVKDTVYWGFIDSKGNFVIEPVFTYASGFIDGMAWASNIFEKVYGYINKQGEYLLKFDKFEKLIDLRFNKRMF